MLDIYNEQIKSLGTLLDKLQDLRDEVGQKRLMAQSFQQYYDSLLQAANTGDVDKFIDMIQRPCNNTICRNNRVLVRAHNEDQAALTEYLKKHCKDLRLDLIDPEIFYTGTLNNQVVHAVLEHNEQHNLCSQLRRAIKIRDIVSIDNILGLVSYVDFDEILHEDRNIYYSEVVQKYL